MKFFKDAETKWNTFQTTGNKYTFALKWLTLSRRYFEQDKNKQSNLSENSLTIKDVSSANL